MNEYASTPIFFEMQNAFLTAYSSSHSLKHLSSHSELLFLNKLYSELISQLKIDGLFCLLN